MDRSDGGKEVRERATKRKLPFTVGANGEQKDSDTGTRSLAQPLPLLLSSVPLLLPDCLQVILTWTLPTSREDPFPARLFYRKCP